MSILFSQVVMLCLPLLSLTFLQYVHRHTETATAFYTSSLLFFFILKSPRRSSNSNSGCLQQPVESETSINSGLRSSSASSIIHIIPTSTTQTLTPTIHPPKPHFNPNTNIANTATQPNTTTTMAVISASSSRSRSYSTPTDPLSIIQHALANGQGAQLIELLASQLKTNQFIGQPAAIPHDFDLSHGSHEVMYVTFRNGPRKEVVIKIGPETIMRHAIDCCLGMWRHPDGRRFMAWELFFYLPCNTRIDYYAPLTARQVSLLCFGSLWWVGG